MPADLAPPSTEGSRPSSNTPTITLLLPTLNELYGMKLIVPQLDIGLFDDVLVLDGGSTDGTVEYARSVGLRVERQKRKGLGPGIFDAISEMKTDYVIEFSPDGNCLVEHLPALVTKLKSGLDLVVVSRYLPPAYSKDDTFLTGIGNYMFTRLFRLLGNAKITDVLGMYRGFRCDIVKKPDFERYLYGPVFEPLVSAYCAVEGLKIGEIAGVEGPRVGGESKISIVYNGSTILLMYVRMMIRKLFGLTV